MSDESKDFRSRGVTHEVNVFPNDNHTGWVISVRSFSGLGMANLSTEEARTLAQMLAEGPGDDEEDR